MSTPRVRLLLFLVFLDLIVLYLARFDPWGQVHVWVLPRAAGLLLILPDASALLFDGDMEAVDLAEQVSRRVPPVWGNLRLAVVTRKEENLFGVQAELFRHLPPAEAWKREDVPPTSATVMWEERTRGAVRPLEAGLALNARGVYIQVVAESPPALTVQVGRMRLVYAPKARWEGPFPDFASGAFLWFVDRVQEESTSPLPPVIVLPPLSASQFAALSDTILRHPESTFFVGENAPIHIVTDGTRYSLELAR